jgi:hypothetical protein
MRIALLALLLAGCGLDLDSSNDDPLLQRRGPARTLGMAVSVSNDNDAPLRIYLRAGVTGGEWTIDVAPNDDAVAHIECAEGEPVCRMFKFRPDPHVAADWSGVEARACSPCGAGSLLLLF